MPREIRPAALQHREHLFLQLGIQFRRRNLQLLDRRQGQLRGLRQVERNPAVLTSQGTRSGEQHLTGGHELVEHPRAITHDPLRQHERLPRRGRNRHPRELVDHGQHTIQPPQLMALDRVLPRRQELGVDAGRHRLHVFA